jgi:hypothetical protein
MENSMSLKEYNATLRLHSHPTPDMVRYLKLRMSVFEKATTAAD